MSLQYKSEEHICTWQLITKYGRTLQDDVEKE